jgi:hypothetical protein
MLLTLLDGPQRTSMFYYFDWTDLNGPVYFITFIWRTSTDLYILLALLGGPQRTSMFYYFYWTDLNGPVSFY